jgi:hypothetical protein
MTERSIDEMGSIDYLVVEFPVGQQDFTGEAFGQLIALHDAGTIRLMDMLIVTKMEDGSIVADELSDLSDLGDFQRIESDLVETLAVDDVLALAEVMSPGSVSAVLVFENVWAAAFGSAVRRAGGQLVSDGRIPTQAIIAAMEADEAAGV